MTRVSRRIENSRRTNGSIRKVCSFIIYLRMRLWYMTKYTGTATRIRDASPPLDRNAESITAIDQYRIRSDSHSRGVCGEFPIMTDKYLTTHRFSPEPPTPRLPFCPFSVASTGSTGTRRPLAERRRSLLSVRSVSSFSSNVSASRIALVLSFLFLAR